ncbi:MAG: transporter substrate-binding domain-containing protein [Chlamydiae bacterium]|nr:transporter substrate-binding domain-containing protein [Chlamydiota bacterium]
MFNKLLVWIALFIGAFTGSMQASDQKNKEPLIVGMTTGYAPYISLSPSGEYEGFDIDFARLLSKRLNREITFQDFGSMPSLMLALKQGKADMLIWAISITKERMEKLEMVYYQGKTVDTAPFVFWKSIPKGISSIADLENVPNNIICVESGSSQEDIIKVFPKLSVKNVDKVADVIMDLKYGKCLSTTIDPGLIAGYVKKYPELKVVYLPIPESAKLFGNGIAINKKNQELASRVREAVAFLIQEGQIAELEKKWNLDS